MNKTNQVMKTQIQKFKILVLLMVSATLLTSCSSDDDSGPTSADLLANKWYIVKTEDHSVDPPIETIADECQQNIYFNFLPDGGFIGETFYYDGDVCESAGVQAATYDISADGDQIYLSIGTPPTLSVLTIEVLTSEDLVIVQDTQKLFFTR